jgi:acetyl-CoA acyltransferase
VDIDRQLENLVKEFLDLLDQMKWETSCPTFIKDFPELDTNRIDDVIVGNATPEAEQGLNLARMISLMGLKYR